MKFNKESIKSLLETLQKDDGAFLKGFEAFILFTMRLVNKIEELSEEIIDNDDLIQFYIQDIDYNFWLEMKYGKATFNRGIHENPDFELFFTKKMIVGLLTGDLRGGQLYMKGHLRANGKISEGLHFIKLLRIIFRYVKEKYNIPSLRGF